MYDKIGKETCDKYGNFVCTSPLALFAHQPLGYFNWLNTLRPAV